MYDVARPLALASGLRVELATGQHGAFATEQRRLVVAGGDDIAAGAVDDDAEMLHMLRGGAVGAVDVLVCTPGRLIDHMQSTPGFTLQHLEFLVIDEADRLLNQSYADWTHRVFAAAARPTLDSRDSLSSPQLFGGSSSGGGSAIPHAVRGSLLDAVAVSDATATVLGNGVGTNAALLECCLHY